jgi:hypothetical protein
MAVILIQAAELPATDVWVRDERGCARSTSRWRALLGVL